MKSKSEFKEEYKEICDLAFSYAVSNMNENICEEPNIKNWTKENKTKFLSLVNEGFKKAQNEIIDQIIFYQEKLAIAKIELKTSRKNRDKNLEKEIKSNIDLILYRLKLLSYIMDGIAWQLFGGQTFITKRFYIGETPKTLTNSNILHVKNVADKINEDPLQFALISDLTNFVQIGDLVIKRKNGVGISELKEGKINEELIEIKNKIYQSDISNEIINNTIKELDKKKLEQLQRMLKQDARMQDAIDVVNNEEGNDHKTGKEIKIISNESPTHYYHNEILRTISGLSDKNWAYLVDDLSIIHIGAYKPDSYILSNIAIRAILDEQSKNYIIADYKQIINATSQPIFAKPLPPEIINEILFDDIRIIIGIDLTMFFERFEEIFGIKTEFLSRKETKKLLEENKENAKNFFAIDNRAIKFVNPKNGNYVILGGGIISKLLFDNYHPISIFEYINELLN
ncbi:hypothetical protein [Chryseobacterium indoltheticum]|nr:hypothetical protein [Chryseobacterium indoltheticum]